MYTNIYSYIHSIAEYRYMYINVCIRSHIIFIMNILYIERDAYIDVLSKEVGKQYFRVTDK